MQRLLLKRGARIYCGEFSFSCALKDMRPLSTAYYPQRLTSIKRIPSRVDRYLVMKIRLGELLSFIALPWRAY